MSEKSRVPKEHQAKLVELNRTIFVREAKLAAQHYEDLLRVVPELALRPPVQYDLARLLDQGNFPALALKAYVRIIKEQKDSNFYAPALKCAGTLALGLKQWDDALDYLEKFLGTNPLKPDRQSVEEMLDTLPGEAQAKRQERASEQNIKLDVSPSGQFRKPFSRKVTDDAPISLEALPLPSAKQLETRIQGRPDIVMESLGLPEPSSLALDFSALSGNPPSERRSGAAIPIREPQRSPAPAPRRPQVAAPAPVSPPPPQRPVAPVAYQEIAPPPPVQPNYAPAQHPAAQPIHPPAPPSSRPFADNPASAMAWSAPTAVPAPRVPYTEPPSERSFVGSFGSSPEVPINHNITPRESENPDERYERLRDSQFALLLPFGKKIRLEAVAELVARYEKIDATAAKKVVLRRKGIVYDQLTLNDLVHLAPLVKDCKQSLQFVAVARELRPYEEVEVISAELREQGVRLMAEDGVRRLRWNDIRLLNLGMVGAQEQLTMAGSHPMKDYRFVSNVFNFETVGHGVAGGDITAKMIAWINVIKDRAPGAILSHTVMNLLSGKTPKPQVFVSQNEFEYYNLYMLFSHLAEKVDAEELVSLTAVASNW